MRGCGGAEPPRGLEHPPPLADARVVEGPRLRARSATRSKSVSRKIRSRPYAPARRGISGRKGRTHRGEGRDTVEFGVADLLVEERSISSARDLPNVCGPGKRHREEGRGRDGGARQGRAGGRARGAGGRRSNGRLRVQTGPQHGPHRQRGAHDPQFQLQILTLSHKIGQRTCAQPLPKGNLRLLSLSRENPY